MRIISSFHDYYDVIQKQGQDRSLIYKREEEYTTIDGYALPMLWRYWWRSRDMLARAYVVGFCGKIWPMLIVSGMDADARKKHCYTPKDVAAWVDANLKSKDRKAYRAKPPKRRGLFHFGHYRIGIEGFFSAVHAARESHRELFERLVAPIFTIDVSRFGRRRPGSPLGVTKNACLRNIEFYRVIDPYTAYQELFMYLGSQAKPEKQIPEVSDRDLASAKGFGKWSFRKPPKKKE